MPALKAIKTERIDVRASRSVKVLLQEAARACHKNVSEFLLDAGIIAADITAVPVVGATELIGVTLNVIFFPISADCISYIILVAPTIATPFLYHT